MGFFEELPPVDPPELCRYVEPEWRRVPREFVPVGVPAGRLVFRSPDIAVVLGGLEVYPTGFTMSVTATRHPEAAPTCEPTLIDALHGRGTGDPGELLRLGVLLGDGRRASYRESAEGGPGAPEASITARGGGGSSETASAEYFVWPVPESGDVTLMFLWPAAGMQETSVVLPGDDLRAAASSAVEIWPGAVVPAHEPPRATGWDAYRPSS